MCKDSRGGARGLKAKKRAEVRRWLGKESRGGAKRFSAPKKPEVGRRAGKDGRGGAMSVFLKGEVESPNSRTEAAKKNKSTDAAERSHRRQHKPGLTAHAFRMTLVAQGKLSQITIL